ncbi:arginine-tRNA-protein transferase [Cryptococcus neoformans c45]|nr:arginine-tRNA-protein transferase [Cryptococcus neoformans var. grubii c45]
MKASPTILCPYGYSHGTCGYCSPPGERSRKKESSKYGMVAKQLSPQYYQMLMDKGWRRSGTYVYHPDMARTCCPQYTIRLDAFNFKSNKKQKQVMNRFNRYLEQGVKPGEQMVVERQRESNKGAKGKVGKGRENGGGRDVVSEVHEFEVGYGRENDAVHRFETQIVPAKVTEEVFKMYKTYQISVHHDKPEDVTMKGFDRFLCSGPLIVTPIKYEDEETGRKGVQEGRLPENYGPYHLLYKVDGQLIAISVLDITPLGVSSVYCIWDPDWAWASLGKVTALYEISLARRLGAAGAGKEFGGTGVKWVYMGYWVPNCQKMKYKSEYAPSYLLDPGTNVFHELTRDLEMYLVNHPRGYFPFKDIEAEAKKSQTKKLDVPSAPKSPIVAVSKEVGPDGDEDSDEEGEPGDLPTPPPPGFANPATISEKEVDEVLVLLSLRKSYFGGKQLFQISELEFVDSSYVRETVRQMLAAVGKEWIANERDRVTGAAAEKGIMFLG